MFRLSTSSRAHLQGVHPDLRAIAYAAIRLTPVDFRVTEGVRTLARQRDLVAAGASRTLRSRHLTGHAIDVVALPEGEVSWEWPHYEAIAGAMQEAAHMLNIPLTWGGDWAMRDGPHFELPRSAYPEDE